MDGDGRVGLGRTGRTSGTECLTAEELPEQTVMVVVRSNGQIYDVYCPLAMVQTLSALVQAELFRAQLMAMNPHAPDP